MSDKKMLSVSLRKEVRLENVHHGNEATGRGNYIYARLVEADTGELVISATLDYILMAVKKHNYKLVK